MTALPDRQRRLLEALEDGPRTPQEIAVATGASVVRVTSDLARLAHAGHVTFTRDAGAFHYALPTPPAPAPALEPPQQLRRTRHDWRSVDWTRRSIDIARDLGCKPAQVSRARRKHAPETIGATVSPSNAVRTAPPQPAPAVPVEEQEESAAPIAPIVKPTPTREQLLDQLRAAVDQHPDLGEMLTRPDTFVDYEFRGPGSNAAGDRHVHQLELSHPSP